MNTIFPTKSWEEVRAWLDAQPKPTPEETIQSQHEQIKELLDKILRISVMWDEAHAIQSDELEAWRSTARKHGPLNPEQLDAWMTRSIDRENESIESSLEKQRTIDALKKQRREELAQLAKLSSELHQYKDIAWQYARTDTVEGWKDYLAARVK